MRLPRHPYLDPARVAHDLGEAARRDPTGHRLHIYFGVVWCFLLGWPTTFVELAGIPLIVYFLLRTPNIWRTWGSFGVQPLTLLFGVWVLWQAATLAWSPDVHQGLKELAANRWVWAMWMLWPVMERRSWFFAALAAGFLCGNLSQLVHAIGEHWHIPALMWRRFEGRDSGWWDPVVGGSLLVGALGLHLPAALMGAGRIRWIAAAGCIVELIAVVATGTRGAWIAAAALVGISAIVAVARLHPWRRAAGAAGVLILVLGIGAGATWLAAGDAIRGRWVQARDEVWHALDKRDYASDSGARLLMAEAAVAALADHPAGGVGAGGFRWWMRRYIDAQGLDAARIPIHAHAHNAFLHIGATTGAPGLLLAFAIALVALRGAFSELPAGGMGTYAAGPAFALLGFLLVSLFDPVHLNAQTGAVLATLMGMSLVSRPGPTAPSMSSP